jgi:hypothetical protein
MRQFPAFVILAGTFAGMLLVKTPLADSQSSQPLTRTSDFAPLGKSADASALPAAPEGKSTIMGGSIRNLDPVRDQFLLNVVGQKPMTILYDERTQVFRDGVRLKLRELRPEDHASVQTVLDGPNIFALSIHILSQAPQGECQGQILSFDPATGQLDVSSTISPDPIQLLVPANTLIARMGQSTFSAGQSGLSDLATGSIVSVKFQPVSRGRAVVNQISILATPGSEFVIAGNITYLDLNAGQLEVVDPRDEKSYEITFNAAAIPAGRTLHLGDDIRVSATYQSNKYVATKITSY